MLSVEMEVAPFRALTLFPVSGNCTLQYLVEMEVAPFRALTQADDSTGVIQFVRRNGGRPIQGIDTSKNLPRNLPLRCVEMEVAPFSALTQYRHGCCRYKCQCVEMEVAPFRALTQDIFLSSFECSKPVEMEVAPLRA